MRLTTRGSYAVKAMIDLACYDMDKAVTLNDIALRQSILLSYLEQLFACLCRAGMVQGARVQQVAEQQYQEAQKVVVIERNKPKANQGI